MTKKPWLAVAALTLAAGVSACGSSSTSATKTTPTGSAMTKIKVGILPVADVAPLYVGIKEGFFAKQHLSVDPESFQGGAAITSAVVGGSLNFGFAAAVNMILAKAHNLPVSIVANGDNAAESAGKAWSGILVPKNSKITSIKQLAGTSIASNAVDGANELAVDGILEANGVNPSSVHFVILNFPDMPAALESGHVDAASTSEPFVSAIRAAGGKVISPLFEGYIPGMTVGTWVAGASEIKGNVSLVKRFVTAIGESLSYSQSHPAAVRAAIPTYTSIPASTAAKMQLPLFDSAVNTSSLTTQESLMRKLGWLSSDVNLSTLVWSGATK